MVHYADNPKKSTIYVVRELLGLKVRLVQGMIGRERLRYPLASQTNMNVT